MLKWFDFELSNRFWIQFWLCVLDFRHSQYGFWWWYRWWLLLWHWFSALQRNGIEVTVHAQKLVRAGCSTCRLELTSRLTLPPSLLTSTQYWNIMSCLVLYALLAPIYYSPPVSTQLQFLCSCFHHLEFTSLGYSKLFYHILLSLPTQNLFLSFSAFLVRHLTPSPVAQIRLANRRHCVFYKFIYLLAYLF